MRTALVSFICLVLISTSLSGCIKSGPEEEQKVIFPEFNAVADDGLNYDSETTSGPFIAIFSAEWCSNPCHSSMHNIWEFEEGLQVFIFSTDSTEDPQGITLSDWHDAADGYDDEYDDNGELEDEGVSLTSYKFMKGSEVGEQLEIQNPGTIVFVNSAKEITYIHKGILDDQVLIQEKWEEASA